MVLFGALERRSLLEVFCFGIVRGFFCFGWLDFFGLVWLFVAIAFVGFCWLVLVVFLK